MLMVGLSFVCWIMSEEKIEEKAVEDESFEEEVDEEEEEYLEQDRRWKTLKVSKQDMFFNWKLIILQLL